MVAISTRRRQRRPSGNPPPLPRESKAKNWLWAAVAVIVFGVALDVALESIEALHTAGPGSILEWFASIRTPFLTGLAKGIALVTSFGAVQVLRLAVAGDARVTKRFRALVVALVSFVLVDWLVLTLLDIQRPAPGVTSLLQNSNYTFPSWYVTAFAITAFAIPFLLVPAGRRRKRAMTIAWVAVGLDCLSRLYLGLDYPTNVIYAAVMCWVLCEAAYRWFVPDESFPVSYARGGNAAHLDLSGPRAEAVKTAMADQLGFEVADVKPFGLAGSGGSSPLLMTMADGAKVFGKIYATSHVRADRWYRIGRTILYGKLEDETPFGAVRRLAEYEDYALRVLAMNDVKVAQTWGIVELTPNREYMLVTEFFEDSKNLGDSDIDDAIIDEGLQLIRTFWDIGVAHRDVKPANLLVQRRPPAAGGRVGAGGPAHAVAPGRRPREHDADPRTAVRPRSRVRACDGGVHARRDRRGVRVRGRPRDPHRALRPAEGGPSAHHGALQGTRTPHAKVSIQTWSLQRVALAATARRSPRSILLAMAIDSLFAGLD